MTSTAADTEFRFLASDAARAGHTGTLPRVERITLPGGEGRTVSGLRFGAPAAPALVTLHGAGLNAHSFDPTLLALDTPALSIDLPGHGRSDWRADADYRPDNLATDIANALESVAAASSAPPVQLIGHSLGGLTAALVAAALPELVGSVVLIDITPGVSPGGDAGSVAEFITGQREYDTIDEIVDRAIAFGIGSNREALTRGVALNTRRRPDGKLEWTHHLAHLDGLPSQGDDPFPFAQVWGSLQSLDMPITLIRAAHGILSDALIAEWHEQLPTAQVVTLAGPHNLHEAAPRELARALAHLG